MPNLDDTSYVPLTQQLADAIIKKIVAGFYPIGTKIPSQTSMAKEFNVSEITVRRAYRQLALEGIISSKKGRGTIVVSCPKNLKSYHKQFGFTYKHNEHEKIKTELLSIREILCPQELALPMGLTPGTALLLEISRIRSLDGMFISHELSLISREILQGQPIKEELARGESLYQTLRNKVALQISFAEENIMASLCPDMIKEKFHITTDYPLLSVQRFTFSEEREYPFEYCQYYLDASYYGKITVR